MRHAELSSGSTNPFASLHHRSGDDKSATSDRSQNQFEVDSGVFEHPDRAFTNPFYHLGNASVPGEGTTATELSTDAGTLLPDADTVFPAAFGPPGDSPNSNPLFGSDVPGSDDLTDFDAEGYSTLEKIYLFSRSKIGFHRVFIAKSLGMFLRGEGGFANASDAMEHGEGQGNFVDTISPDEAVQYVLPLLNTLAMDEGKACCFFCLGSCGY